MTFMKNWVNATKALVGSFCILSLIACGGGNYVENADRNEVITLGDSIFDLSGDIQRILEDRAGQTFRDYTLSHERWRQRHFNSSDHLRPIWLQNPLVALEHQPKLQKSH